AERHIQFVFTDRHAYLQTAEFHNDVAHLDCIPWKCLQTRDFKRDPNDPGRFERYQAEALVYQHLPVTALAGIVCHGEAQKNELQIEIENRQQTLKTSARPNWYF